MLSRSFVTEIEKRRRQIDTLKIFNDNVTEVKENSEYCVEFSAGQNKMFLDVKLGPNFPHDKPALGIRPNIIHPWVAEDSYNIVAAPGLINYTIHSDLGRIVQAIIREFEQNPPNLLEEIPVRSDVELNLNPHSPNIINNATHLSPPFTVSSPIQQPSFPELQNLSNDELKSLRDDIDLQDKFIEALPQTVEVDKMIKTHMDKIEELAKDNLSKQRHLEDIKKEILEKISCINEMKNNYETLQSKYEKLCEVYAPQSILTALAASTATADEESEHIAESFLQGELDCDTFLKNYEAKRSLGHNRRARHERFSHQISLNDKSAI